LILATAGILGLRQFTQYAIYRYSTQGISFQVSIAMIYNERSIGLAGFATKTQIMTLFISLAGQIS